MEFQAAVILQRNIMKWYKLHRQQATDVVITFLKESFAKQALSAFIYAIHILKRFSVYVSLEIE